MADKVSLILTVLNEEPAIGALIDSLAAQTRPPDELVVVDGGSQDGTVMAIQARAEALPFPVRLIELSGASIAQGRNAAVRAASHPWIAGTDAGVRLDPGWLAGLVTQLERGAPAVGGAFVADPRTPFQLALGATVLPLPEELDRAGFLPSSRSVAFTRQTWEAVGGYPEWLDYGEDVVFDLNVLAAGRAFAWAPGAIVHFRPRETLAAFFKQYFRYGRGDGRARLWTRRHLLRYLVYLVGLPVLAALGRPGLAALLLGGLLYVRRPLLRLGQLGHTWPVSQRLAAAAWVPAIRLVGDVAKMLGYPLGLRWRLAQRGTLPSPVPGRGSAGGKLL